MNAPATPESLVAMAAEATISQQLAQFAAGLRFEDIPATVTERAKLPVLDCIGIGNAASLQRVQLFARALRGAHVRHPRVSTARAESFTLEFEERPHFQADGELHLARARRVEIRCLPRALRIVAPETASVVGAGARPAD